MSIFENMTYEALMERVLGRVSSELDKREGSVIWNSTAPAMAELSQFYSALELMMKETFAVTASREFLKLRAADRSMTPYAATPAVFRADFNIQISIGTRFSLEDLNFVVKESIENAPGDYYSYLVSCETPGSLANEYSGDLIPIEHINGLTYASLGALVTPGEDEEDTESFRKRYLEALKGGYFGGNVADYKNKLLSIPGVKDAKVYRVSNGNIAPSSLIPDEEVCLEIENILDADVSEKLSTWLSAVYTASKDRLLTVGGTVRCVILAETGEPTEDFIAVVQNEIDPIAGEGLGLAPIGHVVKIDGVKNREISFKCTPVLAEGANNNQVSAEINDIVDEYFEELTDSFGNVERINIIISQIEARILTSLSKSVLDISESTLNGGKSNLLLEKDEIPIRKVGD